MFRACLQESYGRVTTGESPAFRKHKKVVEIKVVGLERTDIPVRDRRKEEALRTCPKHWNA
jgi:hypothetical protein